MPLLNYTGKNFLTINAVGTTPVLLYPGVNEVSDEALEACKGHVAFQAFLDAQQITIMLDSKASADGKQSVNFMLNVIPKTFDSKLLKKIIQTDGRDAVVEAAKAQLDAIKNPKKDEGDSTGDHFK